MARNKQKLINYHGSSELPSNLLENLDLGEIAVKHSTNGTAQLVIKTGSNNDSTSKAIFVESAGVVSMINESISSVAGNVDEIARSLSAVSTTTVSAITALASEIISNGEFHQEVRANLSGSVSSLATNLATNYYDKDTIDGKVTTINNNVTAVDNRVTSLSSATEAFSSSVGTNYAKKTEVATAKEEAISSSKTYTDAISGYIATTLTNNYYDKNTIDGKFETTNGNVTQLGTRIGNVETGLENLSGHVINMTTNYATKEEVASASANAISSAKTYVDAVKAQTLSEVASNYYNKTYIDGQFETTNGNVTQLGTRIGNAETAISGLSDSVTAMSADVKSYIDNKLSVVYKFKGSVPTYAALTGITSKENGDVYNVDAAQGTIGQPGYVPAGTNYAWNETGNTWDALGGTIDLSSYATTEITDGLHNEIAGVSTELSHLSGHVINMTTNYATKEEVASASANAISSAKTYVDAVSGYIATTLTENYWTTATTQGKLTTINNNVTAVDNRVTSLSSATEAFSSSVGTNYAKKTEVATAKEEAISSSKTYTDAISGYIATTLTGSYWTSATTQGKLTTINNNVTAVDNRVTSLSSATESLSAQTQTIEATANAALNAFTLNTVSNAGSTQSGAKAAYTAGGGAVLDLSELVIDCGNW